MITATTDATKVVNKMQINPAIYSKFDVYLLSPSFGKLLDFDIIRTPMKQPSKHKMSVLDMLSLRATKPRTDMKIGFEFKIMLTMKIGST